jgi:hypothetical protein
VSKCASSLNACIGTAKNASGVAACNEANAKCVASSLNVTLPDVPVSKVVSCAETAAKCALDASSVSDVTGCARGLTSCAAAVVGVGGNPETPSCSQKWTSCVASNPLNFLKCAADLTGCKD